MIDPLSIPFIQTSSDRPPAPVYPTRKLLIQSPEHPDDYILELDYSHGTEVTRCPRAAENILVRSREGNGSRSATEFGDLFHRCEALRLELGLTPEVIKRQHELVAEHFLYHPVSPTDHRTAARMVDILNLYNERYGNDGWVEKVIVSNGRKLVECPFKVPLCTIAVNATIPYHPHLLVVNFPCPDVDGKPYFNETNDWRLNVRNIHIIYTGKMDVGLRESNYLWVVDHKTSSRGGNEYYSAFNHSLQTRGYVWAAQKFTGLEFAGLILNALVILPLTKTGKGQEFTRPNYFYSPDSIAEWEDNMKAIAADFVAMLVRGYFPQYGRSFKSPCSGCEFFDNCKLPREQRAADLASNLFRDVTWNPMHE